MKSIKINKKRVFAFTSKNAFLDFIDQRKGILFALNAEKLNKTDPRLDELINSNYGYPDGVGAVMAMKRKGVKAVKIAGAEYWLHIISKYHSSKSFYLIGSTQLVIESTIKKLKEDFPETDILGYRNGYFQQGDKKSIMEAFKKLKPDIVFVAMGSPKQENLMAELFNVHPALYMGLGGSFDVYSGLKKRAPKIFIDLGLEWFYRLLKEPTRITRQLNLVEFFFKIIFGRI
nr:WecB/TagA/CpsF family glycosyltransferase [uncultured Allomuricauda sp.]